MLKDMCDGVNASIIQVLEKDMNDRHYNLLDVEDCIEYTDKKNLNELEEKQFNEYYGLE